MSIKHKVVVITGASSGIGEATAKLLGDRGAKVVLAARRKDKLARLSQEITDNGGEAIFKVTDVTSREDNLRLMAFAKERYGRIDVVFLNAGLMPNSFLSDLKSNDWREMVEVNLMGVLNGLEAILPEFKKQQFGQVITTSSVAGLKAYTGCGVYGATKWAVRDLMEVLRMESANEHTNIRTTTIYPAAIRSELLHTITDEQLSSSFEKLYDDYAIPAERIASLVAFAIDQPEDTNVSELTVGPTRQAW